MFAFSSTVVLLLIPVVASAQAIPEDAGMLTTIETQFLNTFAAGYALLLPWALRFLWLLSGIEIVWAALYWAFEGENFLPQLVQKTVFLGVFAYLVLNWQALTNLVVSGFVQAGATAGGVAGGGPAIADLRDPSQIVNQFWRLAAPIAAYQDTLGTFEVGKMIMFGFAYIVLAIAVFIIAIQCALTYLEFYIVSVIATVLVPFGVNRHTAFLAERSFGAVISHGMKLAVLSFILAVADRVLNNIVTPAAGNITYAVVFNLDAAALLIAFIAWHAPSIAAGLFGGGPALHAGTASRSVGGGAFMLGRMLGSSSGRGAPASSLGTIRAAAGAIGSGTASAALALTGGAGAVVGAARGGAAVAGLAGAGRVGQAAAGVAGVARMAGGAAYNAGSSAMATGTKPAFAAANALKASWQAGQASGAKAGGGFGRP